MDCILLCERWAAHSHTHTYTYTTGKTHKTDDTVWFLLKRSSEHKPKLHIPEGSLFVHRFDFFVQFILDKILYVLKLCTKDCWVQLLLLCKKMCIKFSVTLTRRRVFWAWDINIKRLQLWLGFHSNRIWSTLLNRHEWVAYFIFQPFSKPLFTYPLTIGGDLKLL